MVSSLDVLTLCRYLLPPLPPRVHAFRLFSEHAYNNELLDTSIPEIQRSALLPRGPVARDGHGTRLDRASNALDAVCPCTMGGEEWEGKLGPVRPLLV